MSEERNNLKNAHEEAVSKNFINLYDSKFAFKKHGDDLVEPDCFFEKGCEKLGVEVVSIYYSDEHAKKEWDFARSIAKKEKPEGFSSGLLVDQAGMFLERIQKEINKKCKKKYTGADKTNLCIENRNPLGDDKDLDYFIKNIKIPDNNFAEIFMLHLSPAHEGGEYKIIKLEK